MDFNQLDPETGPMETPEDIRPEFDQTRLADSSAATPYPTGVKMGGEHWIGRTLGKYVITEVLGIGGMGIVLKGHDPSIDRNVAIKVLPRQFSANQNNLERFLSEAKSAGRLNHPNVVTIHEVAQDGQTQFLVMELVSGGSAASYLEKNGPFSVPEATRLMIEVCRGVTAAHRNNLVHRDLKPANILLSEEGAAKISDFGLAKNFADDLLHVTQEGQLVGTPYFMSPEQCESKPVDNRSDIYSLGATYYTLLTGGFPYGESDSVVKVMFKHCHDPAPDPRKIRAEVPLACANIIQRAMAIQPGERYQTTDEMRADLEEVLAAMSGHYIRLPSAESATMPLPRPQSDQSSRRKTLWGILIGVVACLLAGFFFFPQAPAVDPEADPAAILPPPAGNPIKVGVLHSLTGTMAVSESPVVDAVLLAVEEINNNGGLLNRPVEAVVADAESDSAQFAVEATRLIKDEEVCTVFGCWTSASRKTVVPIFEELDHLLVYPLQYEGIEESPNVIYTGATPNQQVIPAVKWAYAFDGRHKFFLVGSDYVFPRVAHEIIKDQLDILGAELVGEAFLPLGGSDVQSVVDQIVAVKPDVILNSINGETNIAFFRQLRAAGVTPKDIPTISFSIGEAELQQLDARTMAGDFAAWNYFQSIDSPENQSFVAHFKDTYGESHVVTDPMEAAYLGVKIWAEAVEACGSTDPSQIRREMRNHRINAPEGNVRIDAATQHAFKTPRIGQVLPNGQFDIVWTAIKPMAPVPYPPTRTTEQWKALLHDLYSGWNNEWAAPVK